MGAKSTPRISLEPMDEFEMFRRRATVSSTLFVDTSLGADPRYRRVSEGARPSGHRLAVSAPASDGVRRRASDSITSKTTCQSAQQQLLLPPTDTYLFPSPDKSMRRRSFATTMCGVVNEGDIIINDANAVSTILTRSREGSTETEASEISCSSATNSTFRVLVLGSAGVGKTALTQQFMTSEYMAAQNTSFDDGVEVVVPVQLDGKEYTLQFIDIPYNGINDTWKDHDVSCYVIVFAINDRRSYTKALDILCDLRQMWANAAIILAANKSDLVRTRIVGEQEGRSACDINGCPYIEVSAVLNHRVDDLLVTILKETLEPRSSCRLSSTGKLVDSTSSSCWPRSSSSSRFLSSLYRSIRGLSKSCDSVTYKQ